MDTYYPPLKDYPEITQELIAYLEMIIPDMYPSIKLNERELWSEHGKVEILRHLKALRMKQQEEALAASPG